MAPKKPKQPTMLQRQRALRKQQQQTKQQASNQLPPKGGTSANTRQARGQRTSTAKAQAANQQRVIARGMEGFVRRGQAMDKLDKAAKGTQGSGTRTAGAGGGLAPVSMPVSKTRRLPPSSQGGSRIGNSSQPWGERQVRKVQVRDLGPSNALKPSVNTPKQLPAAQQGPQPATRRQQAQAKADAAARGSTGPNRVGQPAGAANRRYGANVVNEAVSRAQQTTRLQRGISRLGRGSVAAMFLGAANLADDSRLTPEQLKKKYEVVDPNRGQRIADNLLGRNQKPKPKQGDAQSRFAGARDRNIQRINSDPRFAAPTEKPKPPTPPRPKPPAASAPPTRPSASRPSQTTPSRTTATSSGSQQVRPAEKKPSMGREAFDRSGKGTLGPNYGIDQFGDKNGIDMERRRAFLDAKDSQEGRKAISKLMEERRKKQRENDSTSK